MRIVYISTSIIPSRTANSIHVMKMCQAFADQGHEVILLAPDYPYIEHGIDNVFRYYGVKENFTIKKLHWTKIKGRSYFYGFLAAKTAHKLNPDIIYGRFLTGCSFAGMISNKAIIFESHQPIKNSGKIQEFLFNKLIRKRNFKRLVLITESLKNYYKNNYNITGDKLLVAHDGADIPPENIISAELKLNNNNINVGYVGHLYRGKGMEIISELAQKCPWANFHIIGGLNKDVDYWKSKLEHLSNIYFYGFVPHSVTVRYIKACDVLLAPYQNEVFGYGENRKNISSWMSPLKIFEYMSLAKPIISSNLPVLREVLVHGHNALLCRPNDINEWIDALKKLQIDLNLRQTLGSNAYKEFIEKYLWNSRAEKVIRI